MIRAGKMDDLNKIEDMVSRAKIVMKREGNEQWNDDYPKREHYETDLNNGELYVCEMEGEVVGACCISDEGHHEYKEINWSNDEPYLCIKRLVVDPRVQGKGIGKKFYEYIEALAKERGINYVRTDTNEHNKAAIRLFEKSHYALVDKRRHGHYKGAFCYFEKEVE